MKHLCYVLLAGGFALSAHAQTTVPPTPKQFLGYGIGERFTPHLRAVAYAEEMARRFPKQVKLLPYGQTYEGRPLLAVAVASEANLSRLDDIRQNNLRRIGLLDGNVVTAPSPAISWISYNVHGNEAVSTEAFFDVLHGLLDPANALSQKILANSVVILDPDLNPDGHDRYVNWYNQMMGRQPDPNPAAREHREPWPGGRYTHYYFDPNRDWAWQTQEITQQRMALYQQWMPHLHGDFHEMGPESPYYFAPSARPYHEDITPWQREFQQTIGQYNSRAFDKNGWLYYTRERFDLFYPSYGDTWPTYNGAIGMTFEQGGSGFAGLAVQTQNGDTLTLRQRIDHHVAATFATLESVADRPDRVVQEFTKFFDNARTKPAGPYKSYVVKSAGDAGRLRALTQLLDRNQIRWGYAGRTQNVAGAFNYFTGQTDKSLNVAGDDVVISAYQPKSTLLKILFEPKSALEDSATYDITAWTLPYAFNLPTYGLSTRLDPQAATSAPGSTTSALSQTRPYAYVARWQSMPSVQLLAELLRNKVRVRAAEKPFTLNKVDYPAGTLLITRAGNERLANFDQLVQNAASRWNVALTPATTGFVDKGSDFGSDFVSGLKAPRVATLVGDGLSPTASGEVWHYFDQELQYPVTVLTPDGLSNADLSKFDVLVMPTGSYSRILNDATLGKLRSWLQAGGKLIALERAADALAGKEGFGLKEKEDKEKEKGSKEKGKNDGDSDALKRYGDRERSAISDETPGSIYRVTLDPTHPLAFGLGDTYYALVQESHNFGYLKDGWNVGYLKGDGYVAGFAGKNAKEKLKNTLSMGVQPVGRGTVVYLADNPLFRGFWYSGKLLFANAVFMTGN